MRSKRISRAEIKRWIILMAIVATAYTAFLVMAGDDIPGKPMSMRFFIASKLIAGAVFLLCIQAGRFCSRRGLLPRSYNSKNRRED